jgi:hypothetical protein
MSNNAEPTEPSPAFESSSRAEPRVGLGLVDLWLGSARLVGNTDSDNWDVIS